MRVGPALACALALAIAGALALAIAGCGSQSSSGLPAGNRIRGNDLTVYVSVPLNGPSAVSGVAVLQGAELALSSVHGRIGHYRVSLKTVDDASSSTRQWSAPAAGQAAQSAASNPTTIGYIGDLNSGASAVSIPILNRLGIAQISPASTAVGLTSDGPGSSPGEPWAYYPTSRRTFVRVVPSDLIQAEVQVELQQRSGCRLTYVLDDDEYDGEAITQAFDEVAAKRGLQVVATQSYIPTASNYTSVGQTIAQSGADCVLIAAITDRNAPRLTTQVAAAAPHVRLFGTAGLAESTFADPGQGGVPLDLDSRILITFAGGDPTARLTGAAAFVRAYTRAYGVPEPVAIDGYEAMNLMLSSIRRATDDGRRRATRVGVVNALFSTRDRHSPLGSFSVEPDGDVTLDGYGVYRIVDGQLHFRRSIDV